MRRRLIRVVATCGLFAAVATTQSTAADAVVGPPPDLRGRYIVVLKTPAAASGSAPAVARARGRGVQVSREFRHAISGYAARLDAAQLATVRSDPDVEYVEPDQPVRADATDAPTGWGLDRVDQRRLPLDGAYTHVSTGAGVTAFVVDSGIRTTHQEFGGRASGGASFIDDGHGTDDCYGHGTHVAGILGGRTHGVARAVRLVGVRVLDCDGFGTVSGVIAGVDWVLAHRSGPAVVNLSLTSGVSRAFDQAVRQAIGAGLVFSLAAGNNNGDACDVSPARVPRAITVGATTISDSRDTVYSNFGRCVDLFAPGTAITSSWSTSDSATNTISGTSMAAPHVAGVAALYLQRHPNAGPNRVRDAIMIAATRDVLTNVGRGSPNVLLYSLGRGF